MMKKLSDEAYYRFEHEMAQDVARTVTNALVDARRRGNVVALREVPALEAVPDITLVRLDPTLYTARELVGLKPLSSTSEVDLVLALRRGPRRAASLPQATGLQYSYILTTLLPALEEKGWVNFGNGTAGLTGSWLRTVPRVITIETKLKDWRRAAWQARTQQWSADAAYLCLDEARAAPALRAQQAILDAGVGLLTMNRASGRLTMHHRAKPLLTSKQRARGKLLLQENAVAQLNSPGHIWPARPIFGWTPGSTQ